MFTIETQHKRIPWTWVILLHFIGNARILALFASGSMTFTMRKYIESPFILNSFSTLDILGNLLIAAPCLYYSDRIWTRFGRRLPFILTSFVVLGTVIVLLPLAGSVVPLVVLVVLWCVFWDLGSTYDTMIMEIIPPEQRGRSAAIGAWIFQAVILLATVVINGRFDDVVNAVGVTLNGEKLIYWWGASCLFFCVIVLVLFVRERPPVGPPPPDHGGGIKGIFTNLVAEKSLWPVYLLVLGTAFLGSGLGSFEGLLMFDQWGYSKQDMGTNQFVGGIMNLCLIIPLVGLLTDKMDRLKMFAIGVIGGVTIKIAYYVFVQFILPEQRPTIGHMIFFGQMQSAIGQFSGIAMMPLLFEYIPRDKMGTAQAGFNVLRSITRLITLNGIGLWVTYYSKWFMPPGQYDYFSGYAFSLLLDFVGLSILGYFAYKVKTGVIKPVGRTGFVAVEDAANKDTPPPKPAH